MAPGFTYGSKVNAPDTWTGPLADAEAECTEQDVDELAAAFIDLSEAVGEQQRRALETVENEGAGDSPVSGARIMMTSERLYR